MNASKEKTIKTRGRTLDYAAPLYDLLIPICTLGQSSFYFKKVITTLNLSSSDTILDIGCGTGVLQKMISSMIPEGSAVGIDASCEMIKVARKKRDAHNISFDIVAAENLPYSNESFDKVCSLFFFHHVDYKLKVAAVKEVYRTLKPKGIFVVVDIDRPTNWFGKWCLFCGETLFRQPEIGENRKGRMTEAFLEGGFHSYQLLIHRFGYTSMYIMVKE